VYSVPHHNIFWWIGLLCAVVTFPLLFFQSQRGNDETDVRKRLDQWYYSVRNNWHAIPGFAIQSTERFLSFLFGASIVSVRFVFVAGTIAILANFILNGLDNNVLFHDGQFFENFKFFDFVDFGTWLINAAFDITAIALSRVYLRNTSRVSGVSPLVQFVVVLCIGIVAVDMAYLVIELYDLVPNADDKAREVQQIIRGHVGLWYYVPADQHARLIMQFQRIRVAPAGSTAFVLMIVFTIATLIYYSRPLTQRPLAAVLSQLVRMKGSVVNFILGFVAAISMFVTLFAS
jgi:hypothetical protein